MTILNGENLGAIKTSIEGLLTTQPNHADTFNAKFKELIDNDITLQATLQAYVDEQVTLVTSVGVPKLASYNYSIDATSDNQTDFTIPLSTFNKNTDTVLIFQNGTSLNNSDYSITQNQPTDLGVVNLTSGVSTGTNIFIVILKNVAMGSEGTVNGSVILDGTIPLSKLSTQVVTQNSFDTVVSTLDADYIRHPGYAVAIYDGNGGYAITLDPAPTSYKDGMCIKIKLDSNSGSEENYLNVNGLGWIAIVNNNGLFATGLKAEGIYTVVFNSTTGNFILQGEGVDATPFVVNINGILNS